MLLSACVMRVTTNSRNLQRRPTANTQTSLVLREIKLRRQITWTTSPELVLEDEYMSDSRTKDYNGLFSWKLGDRIQHSRLLVTRTFPLLTYNEMLTPQLSRKVYGKRDNCLFVGWVTWLDVQIDTLGFVINLLIKETQDVEMIVTHKFIEAWLQCFCFNVSASRRLVWAFTTRPFLMCTISTSFTSSWKLL